MGGKTERTTKMKVRSSMAATYEKEVELCRKLRTVIDALRRQPFRASSEFPIERATA
jgi:hypothetical protein